jgi:hypothetical protein
MCIVVRDMLCDMTLTRRGGRREPEIRWIVRGPAVVWAAGDNFLATVSLFEFSTTRPKGGDSWLADAILTENIEFLGGCNVLHIICIRRVS